MLQENLEFGMFVREEGKKDGDREMEERERVVSEF